MLLKNSHREVESFWVAATDQTNKRDFVVRFYYRLSDQGDPVDEAFVFLLQEALCLRAFILIGGFNH